MPASDNPTERRPLTVRGWTGEYFQIREVESGDYRLWHPDGSYFGRLVTDAAHVDERASGTVYGPTGIYLADAVHGRLHVDPCRRRARATDREVVTDGLESPGPLPATERRWPRRGVRQLTRRA